MVCFFSINESELCKVMWCFLCFVYQDVRTIDIASDIKDEFIDTRFLNCPTA